MGEGIRGEVRQMQAMFKILNEVENEHTHGSIAGDDAGVSHTLKHQEGMVPKEEMGLEERPNADEGKPPVAGNDGV